MGSTKIKKEIVVDGETYEHVPRSATTVVNVILDMSGSMMSVWDATIDSYNEYINGLKASKSKFKVSLTVFDTVNEHPYTAIDLAKVPKLTRDVYAPRGGTALYDAVCTTLKDVEPKIKPTDKSLVVIITDGGENSSSEYGADQMKAIKADLEKKGNWSFVYLGANQDAWATAQQWGFGKGNTATFHASSAGMRSTSANMSKSTMEFASSDSMSLGGTAASGNYFTPQQQDELEETK